MQAKTQAKTKGRVILIAIVLFFALPALVAKAVLSNHWYQSGITNKGTLIEPRVTLSQLGINNPLQHSRWQMAYLVPDKCDDVCRQQLHLLTQSHTALGKEQGRVSPVLLLSAVSDLNAIRDLTLPRITVNQRFMQTVGAVQMVIIDPLGQLVMGYTAPAEQQAALSRNMLADMRKLLKLSRVG
ncbi:hypothetical protein ABDK09_05725 [Vibrio sp. CDRSL-10 TSBA]